MKMRRAAIFYAAGQDKPPVAAVTVFRYFSVIRFGRERECVRKFGFLGL